MFDLRDLSHVLLFFSDAPMQEPEEKIVRHLGAIAYGMHSCDNCSPVRVVDFPQAFTLPVEGGVVTREKYFQDAGILALSNIKGIQLSHTTLKFVECIAEAFLDKDDIVRS